MLFAILKKVLIIFYNENKECTPCNIEKSLRCYYENKDQLSNRDKLSNEGKLYYEKNRDMLFAKSKLNQQNRKSHTQQIKYPNKKAEELTQTMETFNSKI